MALSLGLSTRPMTKPCPLAWTPERWTLSGEPREGNQFHTDMPRNLPEGWHRLCGWKRTPCHWKYVNVGWGHSQDKYFTADRGTCGAYTGTKRLYTTPGYSAGFGAFLSLCPHTHSTSTGTVRHSEAPALTNIDGPASLHSQLPRLWRQAEGRSSGLILRQACTHSI